MDGVAEIALAARRERVHRGASLCRQMLAEAMLRRPASTEAARELSPSDLIRERAIARATAERRAGAA